MDLINNNKNRINDYIKDIHYSCHFLENPDNIYSEYIKKFDGVIPFLMSSKVIRLISSIFLSFSDFILFTLYRFINISANIITKISK